jgi:hypothetical protein
MWQEPPHLISFTSYLSFCKLIAHVDSLRELDEKNGQP